MSVPPEVPIRSRASSVPSPRWFVPAVLALLLVHAALVALTVRGAASGGGQWPLFAVIGASAVALRLLARRMPDATAGIALAGCGVLAAALVGPGPVAVVALMVLNSTVVGLRWLAWASSADAGALIARGLALPTTVGMALWVGTMAATSAMPVHFPIVYATLLVLPLVALPATTAAVVSHARHWCASTRWDASERWWIGALALVAVVHLLVVAKPEVGYDASTMHLQFAELMASQRQWPFDVTRYIWAVMPLGADHAFAAAYLLGGEGAARLFNLAAGGLALTLLYQLTRRCARRSLALACVCLFASAPLAFVETGSLFSEPLWLAFLMASLLAAFEWTEQGDRASAVGLAAAAAGAMQTKVIAVLWLAPMLAGLVGWAIVRRRRIAVDTKVVIAFALMLAIAAWPYVNAWARTGNPVFPFMNAHFRSPYFELAQSFNNRLYNTSLTWSSPYDLILASSRFVEGRNGAAGFHWLLLYPLVLVAAIRTRDRTALACLLLAALFFLGVYTQQSYLRYLLPFFALITMLGAHALSTLPQTRVWRMAIDGVGTLLLLLNLQFIGSGGYGNRSLCLACAVNPQARADYIFANAPLRTVGSYLNRHLPDARVAYLVVNGPSPAGFTGYSRNANWHDYPFYRAVLEADNGEEMMELARKYQLDHAVFEAWPGSVQLPAIAQFRERYTTTIWQRGAVAIAKIQPLSER